MLDNLRNQASSEYEEELPDFLLEEEDEAPTPRRTRSSSKKLLGMTPQQRFIISVMAMFMVCLLGAMILLVAGKLGI
ncbi:MAG: hypothetical protein JXA13_17555 [Anaerolineales bacterium]|nr:hypothetical protein [Anaerolineales bacterium]